VFGLLEGMPVDEVRGYIDQLIAHELLRQAGDEYPVLQLTADGLAAMKDGAGIADLRLARQRKPKKDKLPRRARAEVESWEGVDRDLFEHLRGVRLALARERGVPPYVIFHDATLRELARVRPASPADLQHIYGMGAKKIEDLGEAILDAVRAWREGAHAS
jgi:ATP-dependent DNA helicase RecQ